MSQKRETQASAFNSLSLKRKEQLEKKDEMHRSSKLYTVLLAWISGKQLWSFIGIYAYNGYKILHFFFFTSAQHILIFVLYCISRFYPIFTQKEEGVQDILEYFWLGDGSIDTWKVQFYPITLHYALHISLWCASRSLSLWWLWAVLNGNGRILNTKFRTEVCTQVEKADTPCSYIMSPQCLPYHWKLRKYKWHAEMIFVNMWRNANKMYTIFPYISAEYFISSCLVLAVVVRV